MTRLPSSAVDAGEGRAMRIVVHDYSGHPFQLQLARALAARGHTVLHLHSTRFQTPKGRLAGASGDPASFRSEGVDLGRTFAKYGFARRLYQERQYGRLAGRRIATFRPHVVLSSNTPLDAQSQVLRASRRAGASFVFWLQDIYSAAIDRFARDRIPRLGGVVGARFVRLEGSLLRASDAVVAITEDFVPALEGWGVPRERIEVVENWAPLDEVRPAPRDNEWARENGLVGRRVLLYSGTLGLKHDPGLLLALAEGLRDDADVRVVVVSEGLGADWLRERSEGHANLVLRPFQAYERLPEVLGTAEVALVILDPEAGTYSVPSKILTYLAAGKPILAALPRDNLGARTIERAGAGRIVPPEAGRLVDGARQLLADASEIEVLGARARAYAEAAFAIDPIADRFERLLGALRPGTLSPVAGRDASVDAGQRSRGWP